MRIVTPAHPRTGGLVLIHNWTNMVKQFNSGLTMSHATLASGGLPRRQPSVTEMSAAGLRAFFNIARDWDLSADEQIVLLGSPGRSTFFKWKSAPQTAPARARYARTPVAAARPSTRRCKSCSRSPPRPTRGSAAQQRAAVRRQARRSTGCCAATSATSSRYGSIWMQCGAAGRDITGMAGPLAGSVAGLVARVSGDSHAVPRGQSVRTASLQPTISTRFTHSKP